ncbi:delta-aminolevulinic acid dehydratase [Spirulina sp. 06S082]
MTFIDSYFWHTWIDRFCTMLFILTVLWAFWFAAKMD